MLVKFVREVSRPKHVEMSIKKLLSKSSGLLVAVWQNRVSICHLESIDRYGIMRLNSFRNEWSTCTDGGMRAFLERVIGEPDSSGQFYFFETLGDFCKEALKEGWN